MYWKWIQVTFPILKSIKIDNQQRGWVLLHPSIHNTPATQANNLHQIEQESAEESLP